MKRITAARLAANVKTNVLCLAVDRLNADFIGAYGNAWIQTPSCDALAARSVTFDSYYGVSLDLTSLYRAFWRGVSPFAFRADSTRDDGRSLFLELKEQGYRVYVVSDSEEIALSDLIEDDACEARFFIDVPETNAPVEKLEDARFYRIFEELARFIAKLQDEKENGDERPIFIWAHFSGWNKSWDFPLDRREFYREDEEDPAPYDGVEPPFFADVDDSGDGKTLNRDDLRQSVVEAYSGGVSTFDETLGGFVRLTQETGFLDETLFILTGARGVGFGAPSALGVPPDEKSARPFYAEEVRLPLTIRLPKGIGASLRLPCLCEPRDLYETIRSWKEFSKTLNDPAFWKIEQNDVSPFAGTWSLDERLEQREESQSAQNEAEEMKRVCDERGRNLLPLLVDETAEVRARVVVVARDGDSRERALVTPEATLRERDENDEFDESPKVKRELFALPDDRYNVNDVANRCVDVVESLARSLENG